MRHPAFAAPLVALAWLGIPGAAAGQTGAEIFDRALDRYEARMRPVESYTVVQDFMGFRSTVRWVATDVRGRRVFAPRRSSTAVADGEIGGQGVDHLGASTWDDPFRYFGQWGQAAELVGRAEVRGRPVFVVRVDEFGDANFGLTPGTFAEGHFEPIVGRFYIDAESYLLRRVLAEGRLLFGGRSREVSVQADLTDYRTVGGVIHPFLVSIGIEGIQTAISDAEQAIARQQLLELEEQLANLPESERDGLAVLLNAQIVRLRGVAGGRLALALRVLDLQVEPAAPAH